MKRIIGFLKSLTRFEKIWLIVFSVAILLTTLVFSYLYTDYTNIWNILLNWVLSPLSALTGVLCVVLAAKGHIATWWVGLINSATYGLIAWLSGYYGDWMLNWFYFIPTQLVIYWVWRRNLTNKIVKMKKMNIKQIAIVIFVFCVITYLFSLFLLKVDNWFTLAMRRNTTIYAYLEQLTGLKSTGPIIDSISNNLQVFGQLFMILMFSEQWIFWIATNVITIAMWSLVIILDPSSYAYSIPTLIMWLAFMVNSFYGAFNWYKKSGRSNI